MNISEQLDDVLTPVQHLNDLWVKRDDHFQVAGACGGKARTCAHLIRQAKGGVVTASARRSPQAQIVARLASHFGLSCRIHTAFGNDTSELRDASRNGAEVVRHRAGYTNVINARARSDATSRQWTLIPFGMESIEAVNGARKQTHNLPVACQRIVVPVGSGMTLAGILHGLRDQQRAIPILAIQIGASPHPRLDRWAPNGWRDLVSFEKALLPYDHQSTSCDLYGIELDPGYEAKCLPFLAPNDCLWIVGTRRQSSALLKF